MPRLAIAEAFLHRALGAGSEDQLYADLLQACAEMRIRYFALVQHVDFARANASGVRLHNYPPWWQEWFDENRLGKSDPVHRAGHAASIGFPWKAVPSMIRLTELDQTVLDRARSVGIGDGFTVPAHVPGQVDGSCSFAVATGEAFPPHLHAVAQLIGGCAFEAARRLTRPRDLWSAGRSNLTDRQAPATGWSSIST